MGIFQFGASGGTYKRKQGTRIGALSRSDTRSVEQLMEAAVPKRSKQDGAPRPSAPAPAAKKPYSYHVYQPGEPGFGRQIPGLAPHEQGVLLTVAKLMREGHANDVHPEHLKTAYIVANRIQLPDLSLRSGLASLMRERSIAVPAVAQAQKPADPMAAQKAPGATPVTQVKVGPATIEKPSSRKITIGPAVIERPKAPASTPAGIDPGEWAAFRKFMIALRAGNPTAHRGTVLDYSYQLALNAGSAVASEDLAAIESAMVKAGIPTLRRPKGLTNSEWYSYIAAVSALQYGRPVSGATLKTGRVVALKIGARENADKIAALSKPSEKPGQRPERPGQRVTTRPNDVQLADWKRYLGIIELLTLNDPVATEDYLFGFKMASRPSINNQPVASQLAQRFVRDHRGVTIGEFKMMVAVVGALKKRQRVMNPDIVRARAVAERLGSTQTALAFAGYLDSQMKPAAQKPGDEVLQPTFKTPPVIAKKPGVDDVLEPTFKTRPVAKTGKPGMDDVLVPTFKTAPKPPVVVAKAPPAPIKPELRKEPAPKPTEPPSPGTVANVPVRPSNKDVGSAEKGTGIPGGEIFSEAQKARKGDKKARKRMQRGADLQARAMSSDPAIAAQARAEIEALKSNMASDPAARDALLGFATASAAMSAISRVSPPPAVLPPVSPDGGIIAPPPAIVADVPTTPSPGLVTGAANAMNSAPPLAGQTILGAKAGNPQDKAAIEEGARLTQAAATPGPGQADANAKIEEARRGSQAGDPVMMKKAAGIAGAAAITTATVAAARSPAPEVPKAQIAPGSASSGAAIAIVSLGLAGLGMVVLGKKKAA
jgi:hypothetical protein